MTLTSKHHSQNSHISSPCSFLCLHFLSLSSIPSLPLTLSLLPKNMRGSCEDSCDLGSRNHIYLLEEVPQNIPCTSHTAMLILCYLQAGVKKPNQRRELPDFRQGWKVRSRTKRKKKTGEDKNNCKLSFIICTVPPDIPFHLYRRYSQGMEIACSQNDTEGKYLNRDWNGTRCETHRRERFPSSVHDIDEESNKLGDRM